MHDIRRLRENAEEMGANIALKNFQPDMQKAEELEVKRREYIQQGEVLKAELNKASKAIGMAKKAGSDAAEEMETARKIRDNITSIEDLRRSVEEDLKDLLLSWPAEPDSTVPRGKSAADNVVVKVSKEPENKDFPLKDHLELGESLGILDIPRGAKIAGTGWPVYMGAGAALERALINYMLSVHTTEHGYTELIVPLAVNADSALGSGHLPKFPEDMYYVEADNLYFIPTAELPVTNFHRGEILVEKELPKKYVTYTPCFRREAGAHGADTRGLLRTHQFNKVELVQITTPDKSADAQEEIVRQACRILDDLEITYRIIELCTGDLSFSAAKCYDIEVWSPATDTWLEASSVSNIKDFQARRMDLRYRPSQGKKTEFVHTLNGSGLATSRLMVSLMETYQTPEGRILVPKKLQPFMNGLDQIRGQKP